MARLVALCCCGRPPIEHSCHISLSNVVNTESTTLDRHWLTYIRVASREYRTSSMLVTECENCARGEEAAPTECALSVTLALTFPPSSAKYISIPGLYWGMPTAHPSLACLTDTYNFAAIGTVTDHYRWDADVPPYQPSKMCGVVK